MGTQRKRGKQSHRRAAAADCPRFSLSFGCYGGNKFDNLAAISSNGSVAVSPLSVTWWTMPSSLTAVPGSHGPRVSGSVIVAISFSPSVVDGGGVAGEEEEAEADPPPPLPPLPLSPFT